MKNIVCKFGGSSLSCEENIRKVCKIVLDCKKNFVVVSAPGKRYSEDIKLTDCLINCFNLSKENKDFSLFFDMFKNRFIEIKKGLNVNIDLDKYFSEIYEKIIEHKEYDYIISRGEFLNALIISKFLNYEFLDSKDIIFFDENNKIDLQKSQLEFNKLVRKNLCYVIPGFYGLDYKNKIKVFSRGGSDITGALISLFAKSSVYENFTDVDGFMQVDPKICRKAKLIKKLNYSQTRALTLTGANVLHQDCMNFLKENDIVLNLRNTFNFKNKGTLIYPDKKLKELNSKIIGLSGKKGMSLVNIKKLDIKRQFNFLGQFITNFDKMNLDFLSLGIDCLSLVVETNTLNENDFKSILDKDFLVQIQPNVSIICIAYNIFSQDIQSRIFDSLKNLNKEIYFVQKSYKDLSFIIVVNDTFFEDVMQNLYKDLF